MEYFAGDSLPLRIGDIVTCADNVPDTKYAYYLIRGTVIERRFGDTTEYGKLLCVVEFTESIEGSFVGCDCPCLMEHLVHIEQIPKYSVPDFEGMFCAMLGI